MRFPPIRGLRAKGGNRRSTRTRTPVPTSAPPRHLPRGRFATATNITTTTGGNDDDLAQDVIDGGARPEHRWITRAGPCCRTREIADALLGGLGPRECAGRAEQGLHQTDQHRYEVRVRTLDELRRSLHQLTQLAQQGVRPDHWRQPVDRGCGGESLVRQAE